MTEAQLGAMSDRPMIDPAELTKIAAACRPTDHGTMAEAFAAIHTILSTLVAEREAQGRRDERVREAARKLASARGRNWSSLLGARWLPDLDIRRERRADRCAHPRRRVRSDRRVIGA